MNAWRVPYEAHGSVVGCASEGSALRSMWRSHGLQPVGAPPWKAALGRIELPGRDTEGKWSFRVPQQTKEMIVLSCVKE
jgi:hypothetical protein